MRSSVLSPVAVARQRQPTPPPSAIRQVVIARSFRDMQPYTLAAHS